MMEGWKEVKLKELTKLITKGTTPTTYGFDFIDKGINFIKAEAISLDGNFHTDKFAHISKVANEKLKRSILQENDILMSIAGMILGKTGIVKKEFLPANTNQALGIIRINKDKASAKFLHYYFSEPSYFKYINSVSGQAAQPNINLAQVGSLPINLPPLPTQRKIAKILSAYDDLIENNLKRIKLLEEMAQIEFNNWYAENKDFEEVNLGSIIGHEIGGGWGAEEQSEEFSKPAYVIRGTDIDELPSGKIEKVPFRFHKKSNLASRKLQDGDIIFEVSGGSSYEGVAKTLLVTDELLKQFDNAVMPASFCKLARPIDKKYSNFLFLFWRFLRNIKGTEVFEIRSASNIVNYNWTAFLKFQKINKPSETELEKFNKIVKPIYKQVYNLGNQNQRLKEARDILLPRLMTGMISV